MKRIVVLLAAMSLSALPSLAQNPRSFVATTGNDANTCTRNNECRTFARALAVTNAGGEVIAIDSGGFGPFYVSQAVTVAAAPGVIASLTGVAPISAVSVNAPSTARVVLRGLTIIMPPTTSAIAVAATGFGELDISHCTVTGGGDGILVAGPAGSFATISDSVASDAYGANIAVFFTPTRILRSRAENGHNVGVGVYNTTATLTDVVADGNVYTGFDVSSNTANTSVTLDHCTATRNLTGVAVGVAANASTTSTVRMNNCVVTDSGQYGVVQISGGFVMSMGNNLIEGSGLGDVNGTITPLTKY
jgi:hypothetical protein